MKYFTLTILFILSACSQPTYSDNDVAAIINGDEITLKDIRTVYGIQHENIPNLVDYVVKLELVKLESEKLGLEVEEVDDFLFSPPDYGGNLDFFREQADYVGMSVEDYYESYFKKRLRREEYMNRYTEEILNSAEYGEDDLELFVEELNEALDELLVKYENDVEILIK